MQKAKKIAVIAGVVLLVAGVGFVVWSFMSGRVAVVSKTPDQNIVLRTVLCNDEIIKSYNDAIRTATNDGEYRTKLKAVVERVESIDNYVRDPNCSYIRFTYYSRVRDIEKSKAALGDLERAAAEGTYLNGLIGNPRSLEDAKQFQESLERTPEPGAVEGIG